MSTLATRIRDTRIARRMAQEELADAVGTSQATITKLESGKSKRSVFLGDIARVLGVSVHWLQDGDETYHIAEPPSGYGKPAPATFVDWQGNPIADAPGTLLPSDAKAGAHAMLIENDINAPQFPAGAVIIIEPAVKPRTGRPVIIQTPDGHRALRILTIDAGQFFVRPANSLHSQPLGADTIVGVVTESRVFYKN